MRIINFVRRLFRLKHQGVGLMQFVDPDVVPYVAPDPATVAQVRAGWDYMERYYARLQQPSQPGDWATGGLITPGEKLDSIPAFLSPGGPITGPDQAEALGLTADARRMREAGQ